MAIIAIIGRPNVGKSSIFNRMVGSRTAIVDDQPGVTRDRIYGETVWAANGYHRWPHGYGCQERHLPSRPDRNPAPFFQRWLQHGNPQ